MRGLGALTLDVNFNFIPAGFVNVVKLITCLSLSFLICKTEVISIPFHRLIAKKSFNNSLTVLGTVLEHYKYTQIIPSALSKDQLLRLHK